MSATWRSLAPWARGWDASLDAIAAHLERATLDDGAYPAAALAELRARGLAALFDDAATPSSMTTPHLTLVNALTARASGSLAITVGVQALALLPVALAGTPAQRRRFAEAARDGAGASLLLTEIERGSNLLGNEASASRDASGSWILRGQKDLINGGERHALLVAMMRTAPVDAGLGAFTLFLVPRDATVRAVHRWSTLPCRGADISSVRFDDTRVGDDAVIGDVGDGFGLVQRTLTISRGGISGLASGAASRARALATAYARTRSPFGRPIVELGAIREHLARAHALDLLAAAISVQQAAFTNAFGIAAGGATAVAKLAACRAAEEAVDEGRRVHGAAALLEERPYASLVRDVLLYGTFDGTAHVMLEAAAARAAQMAAAPSGDALAATREAFATPPRPLVDVLARGRRSALAPVDATLAALAALAHDPAARALAAIAGDLLDAVRVAREGGAWDVDQALRHEAATLLADLEALGALVALGDPGARPALAPAAPPYAEAVPGVCAFALRWLGARAAAGTRRFAIAAGADAPRVADAERDLLVGLRAAAAAVGEAFAGVASVE